MTPPPKKLLIFSQVFLPDHASVGQHMADVAIMMRRRGHEVVVYASNRGYEDPTRQYLSRENIEGVDVRRLPLSSFGKASIFKRLIGTVSFMLQCFFIALTHRNADGILFSTSPPMVGFVVSLAATLRRIPTAYWAMDLNPDQLIALGKIKPKGPAARFLSGLNRFILRRTALVIALDRFMADSLRRYAAIDSKLVILPPWPHENYVEDIHPRDNPFRQRHNLTDKFVIMYSGNHSPSNPLATLLQATLRFRDDDRIRFLFVGGGLGKREVESFIKEHHTRQLISLPYQPLSELRYSLSAADLHVVSLGSDMVGIIHPCKVYGAMAVARPVLFFGPKPSHIADLLDQHFFGWDITHGDIDRAEKSIRAAMSLSRDELRNVGHTGLALLQQRLSQDFLCGQFCQALEDRLHLRSPALESPAKETPECEPCLS
jgi:colanic acid biosynthesis glycosyl transferase WcaI